MDAVFLLLNLAILAITLESDLGRRRIRAFRVLRPALGAAIAVPFFLHGLDTSTWGLLLEVAALAIGIAMGLAACAPMRFVWDHSEGQPRTFAGWAYAFAWVGLSGAKTAATYAVTTWFPTDTGRFMAAHALTPDSIRAAFIFLALGSPLVRPVYLCVGGARCARVNHARL